MVLGRSPPVPLIKSIENVHTCMCCYTGKRKSTYMHVLLDKFCKAISTVRSFVRTLLVRGMRYVRKGLLLIYLPSMRLGIFVFCVQFIYMEFFIQLANYRKYVG